MLHICLLQKGRGYGTAENPLPSCAGKKKNPSQLIWMWNLGSETTWQLKEQGLCELKSIFTPSDNERDGGIFTNIWLFPVPPSCTHKSLSADMPRIYVQRKFQPSQLPKHLFPFWNPFWFLLHSNDFTFFFFSSRNRMLMTEEKDLKMWIIHQSLRSFSPWLTFDCFSVSVIFCAFPTVDKRTSNTHSGDSMNLWSMINYHHQKFIKVNPRC